VAPFDFRSALLVASKAINTEIRRARKRRYDHRVMQN
jgi:hypothetical protein